MADEDNYVHGEMQANHVGKRKRKNKGTVAVFDEDARKEFVTGFRKRKQQRRKVAQVELEKKARQKRIQERAEIRKTRKLARGGRVAEDEGAGGEGGAEGQGEEGTGEGRRGGQGSASTHVGQKRVADGGSEFGWDSLKEGENRRGPKRRVVEGGEEGEGGKWPHGSRGMGGEGGEGEGEGTDEEEEAHALTNGVVTYDGEGTTTVVKTYAIDPNAEEEEEHDKDHVLRNKSSERYKKVVEQNATLKKKLKATAKKVKRGKAKQSERGARKGKLKSSKRKSGGKGSRKGGGGKRST